MPRKPSPCFRPSVESLEDRQLMSVSVSFDPNLHGGRLEITGDQAGNSISILNNGDGHVTVVAIGQGALNYSDVSEVVVLAGNGPNAVHYFQQGDDLNPSGNQLRPFVLDVDLGMGESQFQADLLGHAVLAGMHLTVNGGGNHTSNFEAQGVDIGAQGSLVIVADDSPSRPGPTTSRRKVTTSVAYSGVKEGGLAVMLGNGMDRRHLQLSLDATFAPGSTRDEGDEFMIQGGRFADSLEMFLHDPAGLNPSGEIDGGGGFNTATHFDNVKAVNCQRDIVTRFSGPAVKVPPLGGGLGHIVHF